MEFSRYLYAINFLIAFLLSGLLVYGNTPLFILSYVTIFIFFSIRTLGASSRRLVRAFLIFAYAFVLALQILICVQTLLFAGPEISLFGRLVRRGLCIAAMMLPLILSRYVTAGRNTRFYLPSLREIGMISFSELKSHSAKLTGAVGELTRAGKRLSPENLKTIADDLPRHNSFRYVNNGTLTAEYFAEAARSLDDPHLYIVISNTGSAASEVISVFTRRQFNHASLSFDRDLKTIISYNGGERAYPPGLNHEMLAFFNQKEDASIMVYKLACTRAQKKKVLDKVEEINREGSAYNMLGLVLKYSHKPNIMFCSQFVYKMLQYASLSYFERRDGAVKPSDLVEQDYHRRLAFDYEIFLNR